MPRDDLFTNIHKALRKGLFDVTVRAGATDWADPEDVEAFHAEWTPLLGLLRSHTAHEQQHIFRVLDPYDAHATDRSEDEHEALDALLDDLALRIAQATEGADPRTGLALYRDMARFVAAYLPHLHREETEVMSRIWDSCTDDEIALTRRALMSAITPEDRLLTMRLMLPAIDAQARDEFVRAVAATAPPAAVAAFSEIADEVLTEESARRVRAAFTGTL